MMKAMRLLVISASVTALVTQGFGSSLNLEKETSLITKQPMGELAVAGRLSIDLHAEFMVSRTWEHDTVLNWYNCGYSGGGKATKVGGDFGDFGFQVPFRERDLRYPHAIKSNGVPAVRFDGNDFLKGTFPVELSLTGARPLALEVWLRSTSPAKKRVVLGWQSPDGTGSSAQLNLPAQFTRSEKWRHIVVNCMPTKEEWYLDGAKVASGKRKFQIKPGHMMVLGGATSSTPSFKGDLVAVRLHDQAMSKDEIAHNFKGGVMLGTELHSWWRNEPDKWWVKESDYFRHCVDKEDMKKWTPQQMKDFENRVPGMFNLAELIYHTYSERLAIRSSVVSVLPEERGDGIKYKTPIQPAGGSFMGWDGHFGWACQGEGFINPHELVHGWDGMTGGLAGNYWETHANWPQTYNGIYQTIPVIIAECSAFPSSGRTYYHDRLMFEYLAHVPEYGPMFIAKLWYDGPTETDKSPYPWTAFNRINPYPDRQFSDEYAKMAMKNVTYDYTTYAEALGGKGNTPYGNEHVIRTENLYQTAANNSKADIERLCRVQLQKIPYEPSWWRVPKEQAPQQFGWNVCPLRFTPGKVAATLEGYVNPARGSDWRAGFVGVDFGGKPVYGQVFKPGQFATFDASANIKELYLVVCGTPTKVINIDMVGDFRSFEQEQFPYKVKLDGCEPLDVLVPDKPDVPGMQHANGGGFVASTAQVDATAYVGPKAQVLGNSKVLGNARVEDYAVVLNGTVKDKAIVSGHAIVKEESVVAENAKVRGAAQVKGRTTVKGNAKILEHAAIFTQKQCSDKVVVKGVASVYGGSQSGTAMIDGFYAKGNEIAKGKWFTWSWGQGKNPGEIDEDFGGLYADYDFDEPHPWMAKDSFGTTWGYLVNGAKVTELTDRSSYKSSLLQSEAILPSLETKQGIADKFCRNLTGYLIAPETGDYTFWVAADDSGQFLIGEAGSTKATKLLCKTTEYVGPRDWFRNPTQKSAPVHMVKGNAYPISVFHEESDGDDHVEVAWTRPGASKPEVVAGNALSLTPDGNKPGVLERIWGGVTKVEDLLKRTDYPEGRVKSFSGALSLNGKDQFAELPVDVADMSECTYTVVFKWNGGGEGERLFEFSNANGDALWLSPSENGKLVCAIRKGAIDQRVSAPAPIKDTWVSVRAVFTENRLKLYMNGVLVGETSKMALAPESVRATQCYLGRGLKGGFFGGMIDRFTIHSVALEGK